MTKQQQIGKFVAAICYRVRVTTSAEPKNSPATSVDSIEDRILEAALQQFGEIGIRKSTIEDIAKRAGVDRVTVYRRIGSRDDVVKSVLSRETAKVINELDDIAVKYDSLEERVAQTFITILDRARSHIIFSRLLSLEPEFSLPRLTTDGQSIMAMAVLATLQTLQKAVEDGLLDDAPDLAVRAEVIVRIVHSFVMTPRATVPMDTTEEMDTFARNYLVPILWSRG